MAIKILDPVATDYGVSPVDMIASCQGVLSCCRIANADPALVRYRVSSNVVYRASASAQPLKYGQIYVDVTPEQLVGNLFTLLYARLKEIHPNNEDML